jgi:hypothetical protein
MVDPLGPGMTNRPSLVRTCPVCRKRYAADLAKCSGCGVESSNARLRRDGIDSAGRVGTISLVREGIGVIGAVMIAIVTAVESGQIPVTAGLAIAAAVLLAAVWLARRLHKPARARRRPIAASESVGTG